MKLISFDVWNTLLSLKVMIEELQRCLVELAKIKVEEASQAIFEVRKEIKKERKEGKSNPDRILEVSQELLANRIGKDVEVVKRAVAKATLNVDKEVVIEGARDTLRKVRDLGLISITIGNVMFWPSSYTRLLLEKYQLADYIDRQFYSDELRVYKPMKKMFLEPLRYFSVSPEEALHIGDTRSEDFEGALNAGLYAVWINPKATRIEKIDERGFMVGNVNGLWEVLEILER